MSILVGDCNINIDSCYLSCNNKKYVIKNIANAFTRLGVNVIKVKQHTDDEIIWIRDTYVPIDDVYLKCNLTIKDTMNQDRSGEFKYIKPNLYNDKKIIRIPSNISFEGGDFIQIKNYIFVGIGSRTTIKIVPILKKIFPNKKIVPIHHTGLHLDCCLCILGKRVFYDSKYIENIKVPKHFKIIDIACIVDSGKYMATNLVQVGNTLIMSGTKKNKSFRQMLRNIGYKIIVVDTRNIWKEGGSVRCLTQWL